MSRFQDNNTYKPRTYNRDMSNNNVSQHNNRFKQSRSDSRFGSSRVNSNLSTNSRWKRDEPQEQRNNYNNRGTWNNTNQRFGRRRPPRNSLEPHELNSKFIDLKSISRGFDVITTKPKQNKKKKKKKKQFVEEEQPKDNKNTNKYDLTKEEQDKLNELIINQYNYEVIEETESEGEEELEEEEEL